MSGLALGRPLVGAGDEAGPRQVRHDATTSALLDRRLRVERGPAIRPSRRCGRSAGAITNSALWRYLMASSGLANLGRSAGPARAAAASEREGGDKSSWGSPWLKSGGCRFVQETQRGGALGNVPRAGLLGDCTRRLAPRTTRIRCRTRIRVWDLPTRLFHWLLVACVVAAGRHRHGRRRLMRVARPPGLRGADAAAVPAGLGLRRRPLVALSQLPVCARQRAGLPARPRAPGPPGGPQPAGRARRCSPCWRRCWRRSAPAW